jgi:replicative DNA helicase
VLEIGETSASLHAMARELDVHCLMLSQLNRKAEERADKRPQLSDLRESGDLEQNADLVLGTYREAYYLERSGIVDDAVRLLDVEHVMEVGVLKNRQGPTGVARLYVDMACNVVRSELLDRPRPSAATRGPRLVQASYGMGGGDDRF